MSTPSPSETAVTVTFALQPREVDHAARRVLLSRPWVIALAMSSAVGFLILGLVKGDVLRIVEGLGASGLVTLLLVARTRQWRRAPQLLDEHTQIFSEDAIHITSPSVEARVQWSSYTSVIETPELFLFSRDQLLANIVPRRAFASSQDEDVFRQLVDRHIPGRS